MILKQRSLRIYQDLRHGSNDLSKNCDKWLLKGSRQSIKNLGHPIRRNEVNDQSKPQGS